MCVSVIYTHVFKHVRHASQLTQNIHVHVLYT